MRYPTSTASRRRAPRAALAWSAAAACAVILVTGGAGAGASTPASAAPTDASVTGASATDAPPKDAPPTDAPPTDAPPTDALPTDAPPTDAPPTDPWLWPLDRTSVIREFEAPVSQWSAGHRGIDLAGTPGTTVFAPADGIVHFRGRVVDRGVLSIDHGGGYLSSYEPVASDLRKGDAVARGDPIGVIDAGGHCDASCLHFGVRLHGEYVSPRLLLGALERSVLLPLLVATEATDA